MFMFETQLMGKVIKRLRALAATAVATAATAVSRNISTYFGTRFLLTNRTIITTDTTADF